MHIVSIPFQPKLNFEKYGKYPKTTNQENLTFEEWLFASGNSSGEFIIDEFFSWQNNEDPSEHR